MSRDNRLVFSLEKREAPLGWIANPNTWTTFHQRPKSLSFLNICSWLLMMSRELDPQFRFLPTKRSERPSYFVNRFKCTTLHLLFGERYIQRATSFIRSTSEYGLFQYDCIILWNVFLFVLLGRCSQPAGRNKMVLMRTIIVQEFQNKQDKNEGRKHFI